MLTDTSRIIVLPAPGDYDIVQTPVGGRVVSLLVNGTNAFELREVNGKSPIREYQEPRLPNGGAVKSIILEGEKDGYVLQLPNIVQCTKFNLTYVAIQAMSAKEHYLQRFQTLDDILESFSDWAIKLEPLLQKPIKSICNVIEENGECFYKLSKEKVHQWLDVKVNAFATYIKDSQLALSLQVKATLGEKAKPEVTEAQCFVLATDFIFEAYLSKALKEEYLATRKYNIQPLEEFMAEKEREAKAMAQVHKNMTFEAKPKRAPPKQKKAIKRAKVAVGSGAVDLFFKRAK